MEYIDAFHVKFKTQLLLLTGNFGKNQLDFLLQRSIIKKKKNVSFYFFQGKKKIVSAFLGKIIYVTTFDLPPLLVDKYHLRN